METAASFAVLFVGLGFFLFVTYIIRTDHRESYERRLNEQREFGFRFDPDRKSKRKQEPHS